MWWVGVDVGGTFTDAVLYDDTAQSVRYAKAPSTPGDPTQGVLAALERLQVPLEGVQRLVHGVTIGTNAILERKGAQVWMLTTAGFRDVLEIARTNRPVLYDISTLKTPPIIPRTRTLEVHERLFYDGRVRTPLDEAEVRAALETVAQRADGRPGALAICFLHSYANGAHEQAAARIARERLPEWFVCTSAEVLPQYREYERFNTAALNAYIGPLMSRYLGLLRQRLAERGYRREVFIMTSNGGVATAERAARLPISTVLSGPAGGVAAALHLGAQVGERNLITCDMGGTSTDVCLIEELKVPVTHEQFIAEFANRTPQIEINAVGAGGGSIAWLDAGDILMVGPQSAGAEPGPAGYGMGGAEPTVTDANLALHRLAPGARLGGRIVLDEALALAALERLRARLPALADAPALAEGIVRIAVARMVSAIKQISIAKGFDPRDFALVAYGGAGPMHAAFIAEELEMERILVPLGPGNFAAFGSLISDLRHDHVLTRTLNTRQATFADVEAVFAELEAEGRAGLLAEGVAESAITTARALGMRYLGQSWELAVPLPPGIAGMEAVEAAFGEVHERRFGHRSGEPAEIVNFRLAAIGLVGKPALPPWAVEGTVESAVRGRRDVYFGGAYHDVAIFDRMRLPAGGRLAGPAVIEEGGATTVVPPGWRIAVLETGDLLMEREGA
jgi:N-methylhydantoinase A